MKAKMATYYVEGRMALSVGVEINARSLEEAQEKAKSMKIQDFVEFLGDHNDSNFEVSGVFKAASLPSL